MTKHLIDITPEGCKTPEGIDRVNKALSSLEDARAGLANNAVHFIKQYEYDIIDAARAQGFDYLIEEVQELKVAIQDMNEKQEEFMRAVAGR